MKTEIRSKNKLLEPKYVLPALIIITLASLFMTYFYISRTLNYDKVYKGVYINGISMEGQSAKDLENYLRKNYQDKVKELSLELKFRDTSEKISFSDIGVKYDINGAGEKAFELGRTGNIFERLYEIYKAQKNGKKLNITATYDIPKVKNIVESFYKSVNVKVLDPELLISDKDGQVRLSTGHHGESFNKSKLLNQIFDYIIKCKHGVLNIEVIVTPRARLDVERLFAQISRDASDAHAFIEKNKYRIIPETIGRSIDKTVLNDIVEALEKTEDTGRLLPVKFIKPALSAEEVESRLFKDTLFTASTIFTTATLNDSNRGNNIRIAVSRINGTLLSPGQVFSFNETVGRRTIEGGYKAAHAYSGGKVIDSIGGGVCQVSTTLYNAALFSDLEIVERTNHTFIVKYVPYGRDAAVSYGQVDFKFRNSTKWPIKIEGTVTKSNKIIFTLKGTNENPDKSVQISHKIISTLPFNVIYINDPALPAGRTIVKQTGSYGYIVETYKKVIQKGTIVSDRKIHTSYYKPLDTEILRGTAKAKKTPSANPATDSASKAGSSPSPENETRGTD